MSTIAPHRMTDPDTSRAAARAVTPSVPNTRQRVLAILEDNPDGLTHDQIIAAHRTREATEHWPPASVSSIRTRTNELVRRGLVDAAPVTGRSAGGRRAIVWYARTVQSIWTTGQDGGEE